MISGREDGLERIWLVEPKVRNFVGSVCVYVCMYVCVCSCVCVRAYFSLYLFSDPIHLLKWLPKQFNSLPSILQFTPSPSFLQFESIRDPIT